MMAKPSIEPGIFQKNRSKFMDVSKDTEHDVSMINDTTIPIYNFDGIMREYCKLHSISSQHSSDALYVDENRIAFIEFKNGKNEEIKPKDIIFKLYDSLMVLFDKGMGLEWCRKDYEGNISYSRSNIDFILVIRDESDPREKIEGHVSKRSDYGTGFVKGYLYHDVKIYSPTEFDHYFLQQI